MPDTPPTDPRPTAVAVSDKPAFISQADAVALCAKSLDTIRRYRREGRLPNSRKRDDGSIEVAVADLVAAGLLDPLAAGNIDDLTARSRSQRELQAVRQDLALAQARIAELVEQLARADDEISFLRSIVRSGRKAA